MTRATPWCSGAIDALLDQTKSIERAIAALDLKAIKFEGSDSLDNPGKVQGDSRLRRWSDETELTDLLYYNITTGLNRVSTREWPGAQ